MSNVDFPFFGLGQLNNQTPCQPLWMSSVDFPFLDYRYQVVFLRFGTEELCVFPLPSSTLLHPPSFP